LLLEYTTKDGALGALLSPVVDGASFEDPVSSDVPVTIQNRDLEAGTVRLSLVYVRTE